MKIYQFPKPNSFEVHQEGETQDTITIPENSILLIMSAEEFKKIQKIQKPPR